MLIEGALDSRTLANMNGALDRVCEKAAHGEDHSVRKRVARHIVKCARNGKTSLGELTAAGQRGLIPALVLGAAATSAIVLGGSDAQKAEWLPKIAAGELVATLAIDEGPRFNPEGFGTVSGGGKLTGKALKAFRGVVAQIDTLRNVSRTPVLVAERPEACAAENDPDC